MPTKYDPNSVIDTLKSQGKDSSFASRSALAGQFGISNYTGTAEQNTALMNKIKTPTVISSKPAQEAANQAQDKLAKVESTVTTNVANTPTPEKKAEPKPEIKIGGTETVDPMKDQVDSINASAQAEIDSATSIFNNSMATLDANTQATLNNITQIYNRRREEMNKLNAGTLGAKRVSGLVSGRDRYAQDFQTNILTEEEVAGIKRISDLDAEERQLLQEAKNARDTKSMELLNQKMNQYQEANKAKQEAISALYKNAIDLENLAISKSREERALIKDNIDNMASYADNIAASLVNSFTGDDKKDQALIEQAAKDYGIDPNFVSNAIAEYKLKQQQATPSDLREYDALVARGEYSGSFFNYLKTKKQAEKIASGGGANGTALSRDEATRYDLPEELIGKSDREVVQDLLVSRVPEWFKVSQVRAGQIAKDASPEELQKQWDQFRSSPDMKIYTSTIDIVKSGAKEINTPGTTSGSGEDIENPFG